MMKTKRKPRFQNAKFELRKREFDGKWVRWEHRTLSSLGVLPMVEVEGKEVPGYDHLVWVVTGVFNSRREAFA